MGIPYLLILVALAFAIFFYRASELEDDPTWIWWALSLLISALTIFWLNWSWLGIILSQFGLFIGIAVFRALRKS